MDELEAFEIIKNAPTIYVGCGSNIYTRFPIECKLIETALKALEIIKEKQVDVAMILSCEDADDYNRWCDSGASWSNEHITQQEYAILKEVLL